jgi:hypothetical protein
VLEGGSGRVVGANIGAGQAAARSNTAPTAAPAAAARRTRSALEGTASPEAQLRPTAHHRIYASRGWVGGGAGGGGRDPVAVRGKHQNMFKHIGFTAHKTQATQSCKGQPGLQYRCFQPPQPSRAMCALGLTTLDATRLLGGAHLPRTSSSVRAARPLASRDGMATSRRLQRRPTATLDNPPLYCPSRMARRKQCNGGDGPESHILPNAFCNSMFEFAASSVFTSTEAATRHPMVCVHIVSLPPLCAAATSYFNDTVLCTCVCVCVSSLARACGCRTRSKQR